MARVFRQRVTPRLALLLASEALLILSAMAMSAWLHVGARAFTPGEMGKAILMAALCQVCLYCAELYDFKVLSDRRELIIRLLQSIGSAALVLAVVYFWIPALIIARGVFLVSAIMIVAAVAGWRILFESVTRRMGYRERLLLVGTTPASVTLAKELFDRKELGVQIVGFIDPDPSRVGAPVLNPGVVGTITDIPALARSHAVDRVVVSLADARGHLPMDALLQMKLDGIAFDHLASVYEEYTGKIAVENLRPSWLIFSEGFRKSRTVEVAKRAIDVAASASGLLLAAPFLVLVAVAIAVFSPGPVLFTQLRVGRHGRNFTLYKFRSMRPDAESGTGAVWATQGDTRITPLGRFLRRTRLDELPQLWNVLRGDMSLVGPRPERPEFVQSLEKQVPFYGQRHVVKPGLTGWAQVKYSYGASVEDALEKLQYDLFYIKNMSIGLDLFIAFKTIQTVVLQRGT